MIEGLVLGPPVPHGTAVITADGTANSTSAANYVTTGTAGGTLSMAAAVGNSCPRYVEFANLDAAIVIYVNVGNTLEVPPTPTASSVAVFPGTSRVFRIPSGGVKGIGGTIKHLAASGSPNRSIQWYV